MGDGKLVGITERQVSNMWDCPVGYTVYGDATQASHFRISKTWRESRLWGKKCEVRYDGVKLTMTGMKSPKATMNCNS